VKTCYEEKFLFVKVLIVMKMDVTS